MTTALTYLDSYCERAGDPALWAEPLNAVTNLFFILASLLVARAIWKLPPAAGATRIDFWLLVVAQCAIGIGSGLWHLMPSGTTVLMDVIPITLFIHIYLIASLRRLLKLSWARVGFWWATYLAASIVAQVTLPPDLLNGTILYIPTYLTLALLTVAVRRNDKTTGRIFAHMLGIWTLSLLFRTEDIALCSALPIGTHFLWHTLNAYMLYRLSLALIRASE